jgi:hypothetical protein
MSATDDLRNWITSSGIVAGFRVQFGRWVDGKPSDKFCVIKPAGGQPVSLLRRPTYTITLVGAVDQAPSDLEAVAQSLVSAMAADSGDLVFMQPSEPVFFATTEARPVFEFSTGLVANL